MLDSKIDGNNECRIMWMVHVVLMLDMSNVTIMIFADLTRSVLLDLRRVHGRYRIVRSVFARATGREAEQ